MGQKMKQLFQGKSKDRITEVILHCAAINTGQFSGLTAHQVRSEINRWHEARGFSGFGYHGLIMPDGEYLSGRPYWQMGAHCQGYNRGTIGLLLLESIKVTKIRVFSDWFTTAQMATLRAQISNLRDHGITKVSGHNDYAKKLCPGFRASDYF
jgi:N-acetylmuramoyl-L-alanine amidase